MNLAETLFGGAIIVVLLHIALGRMGIANYWRGVISGATGSFVILSYSLIVGLSLDVVSIHLAVFLATATVMTLISSSKAKDEKGLHWSIKIMVGFFLVLFIVNGAFVSISTNGVPPYIAALFLPHAQKKRVYTAFSGVTRHDEQAASAQNQQLQQLSSLKKLGWGIEIDGVNELVAGHNNFNTIKMQFQDKNHLPISTAAVKIQFFRAGDVEALTKVPLVSNGSGNYSAQFNIPDSGSWIMRTSITADGKHLELDRDVMVKKPA